MGDKTQLLICNLATNYNPIKILIGVALGTLFSHGIAVLLGSFLSSFNNLQFYLQLFTYISFIFFGIWSFLKHSNSEDTKINNSHNKIILSVALGIFIGELGDKTQLASIALSLKYPTQTLVLIIGAIFGMIVADGIAILVGIFLNRKLPQKIIQKISTFVFILFGLIGLFSLFKNN